MDSRDYNTQVRSVPLIQRGDLTRLGGFGTPGQDPVASTPFATSSLSASRSATSRDAVLDDEFVQRREERRRRREEERARSASNTFAQRLRRRKPQQAEKRRRSRLADVDDYYGDEGYDDGYDAFGADSFDDGYDAFAPEPRTLPRDTPRESVSAYMGESSVVSVSRRSERKPRGFSLVPLQSAWRAQDDGPTRRDDPAFEDGDTPWFDDVDDWGSLPSERRASRGFRSEGGRARMDRQASVAPRQAFYDFNEPEESQGIAGAARRREAMLGWLAGLVQAAQSLFASVLRRMGVLVVVGLIALVVFMLYEPARNLYVANRRIDALQATYDALVAENDTMRDQLELLQTREGIENEARARGFVEVGETKVLVEGLPEEPASSAAAKALADVEVNEECPWYITLADRVFGYEPGA